MSKSEEKYRDWVRFATAKPCLSRVFSDAGTFSTAPLYLFFGHKAFSTRPWRQNRPSSFSYIYLYITQSRPRRTARAGTGHEKNPKKH
jgi:hypothetical protein